MKAFFKLTAVVALLASSQAWAQVEVEPHTLGIGTPGSTDVQNATVFNNSLLHSPQYLPGYPTAATIWPRVVEVPCTKAATGLKCAGYNWQPSMGRGEYLFVQPKVVEQPKPVEKIVPTIIYKEVVPKKKRE